MRLNENDVVTLLRASQAGDEKARNALFDAVHGELEAIAGFILRREGGPVSLSTGDLVNETVLRLLQSEDVAPGDKAHLLALSAQVMRRVLIDAARRRNAAKRRKITVTLTDGEIPAGFHNFEFQALEEALTRLKAIDPARARIVVLRYYGGMTTDEIALLIGASEATVRRSWRAARAWLKEAIEDGRF